MEDNFDKFDSPGYSSMEEEFYEPTMGEKIGPVKDKIVGGLKKNTKKIIALIVILVVAYFVYDYFIGSYRTVEFSLKNTEGGSVSATSFKIFDNEGNKVFSESGQSTFIVQLKAGSYRLEARVGPDYELYNGSITVSEGGTEEIEFEKNLKSEITDFKQNFPKTLVAGQETSFEMTINNPSGEPEQIEIVASSSLEELNIEIPSVLVQANSSETLTVTLSVPENMQFDKSEEEDGKELSGYVRIKFTNEKETLPDGVRIYPRPELEFNPSSMTIRGDAGETVIKEFNLENKSPFTLYDITLTLEITSVSKNPQEQIEQSLTLVEGNVISTLEGKGIGNNEANNRLKFEIPITAKTEEITGNIIAEAEMFPQPIIMPLTLEIQDEAEFELTITPETKSVTVDYIETSGTYEKITKNLRVKNTGEMTLKNIQVLVKNDKVCTPGWLKFLDETRINSLGEGQTQNILMELSAPLGHDGTTMQCKIRYYYDNPLEPESRVDGELDGSNWIQITPRSS